MRKFGSMIVFFAMATAVAAQAGELDRTGPAVPQGLIVRVDNSGNREVFKAQGTNSVTDAATAADSASTFVQAENKIATVVPASELDQTSSDGAWYYWYNYSYSNYSSYYYGYNYYGYNYYYRPCYNWYNAGYNYYNYYRRY